MIDRQQAAEVARQHELSLSDAWAISLLADTVQEAHDLAERFAPEGASA